MTAVALAAIERPADMWPELEALEPLDGRHDGDATYGYAHRMRAERRRRAAELAAAIRRAERSYAALAERLVAAERRAAQTKSALAAAGAIERG